jgi:hypothetical protein
MRTLVPAYGRDYKNKRNVSEDFEAGKDFINQSFGEPDRYINRDAFEKGERVKLRYNGLRDCIIWAVGDPPLQPRKQSNRKPRPARYDIRYLRHWDPDEFEFGPDDGPDGSERWLRRRGFPTKYETLRHAKKMLSYMEAIEVIQVERDGTEKIIFSA